MSAILAKIAANVKKKLVATAYIARATVDTSEADGLGAVVGRGSRSGFFRARRVELFRRRGPESGGKRRVAGVAEDSVLRLFRGVVEMRSVSVVEGESVRFRIVGDAVVRFRIVRIVKVKVVEYGKFFSCNLG